MYFVEKKDFNRRQTRYLNFFFKFNIKIIYRFEFRNIKIDALIKITGAVFKNLLNEKLK